MPRYFDADKIELKGISVFDQNLEMLIPLSDVRKALQMTPTADVQEVRHGKWMYCGKLSGHDHKWQCSECLRTESTKHKSDIKDYPYCHCGAKMDGEMLRDDKV